MPSSCLRGPKDTTLRGQTNNHVISRFNILHILMTKLESLNSRLVNWVILWWPQKTVKGQALADFLAAHSVSETSKLNEDIPDEVIKTNMTSNDKVWQMFFDGVSRMGPKEIVRVGVVFISPHNHVLPCAFSLTEPCSNNVAGYNALLVGLQLIRQMGYNVLKPMVTPCWLSVKSNERIRFVMKIWYLFTRNY